MNALVFDAWLVVWLLHLSCVGLSLSGFVLRGWWMWRDSPLLGHRGTRLWPHVVDSVLLGSGVGLMVLTGQYPWSRIWLAAKLLALLLYIVLGSIALKRGRSRTVRGMALLAALLVFAYMLGVALQRSPLSWAAP